MPKPIKIEFHDLPVLDPTVGAYTQYVVTANSFVIASFVDETSRLSYNDYLKQYGFKYFPENVMHIIRRNEK